MDDVTIDREFASRLRDLDEVEEALLEKQLLELGCLDDIKVWANHNDVVIDGHNRLRLCKKHGIKYKIKPLKFASREEVLQWIDDTHEGRRNQTDLERAVQRGRRYNKEKNPHGTNQHAKEGSITVMDAQTAKRIATESGVGQATIERDAKLAKAIDAIKDKTSEKVVKAILTGEVDMTRKQIAALANKSNEEIVKAIDELKNGKKESKPKDEPKQERDTSWPAMLKWAAKRKSVTKDELAEHFGVIDADCRKRLATACQTTSNRFMVIDLGEGKYRVERCVMMPAAGDDMPPMQVWKELHEMAEYGARAISSNTSIDWSRQHQMKMIGTVLALTKQFLGRG